MLILAADVLEQPQRIALSETRKPAEAGWERVEMALVHQLKAGGKQKGSAEAD